MCSSVIFLFVAFWYIWPLSTPYLINVNIRDETNAAERSYCCMGNSLAQDMYVRLPLIYDPEFDSFCETKGTRIIQYNSLFVKIKPDDSKCSFTQLMANINSTTNRVVLVGADQDGNFVSL